MSEEERLKKISQEISKYIFANNMCITMVDGEIVVALMDSNKSTQLECVL